MPLSVGSRTPLPAGERPSMVAFLRRLRAHVNVPTPIGDLKKIYSRYDRQTPFTYQFLDDAFRLINTARRKTGWRPYSASLRELTSPSTCLVSLLQPSPPFRRSAAARKGDRYPKGIGRIDGFHPGALLVTGFSATGPAGHSTDRLSAVLVAHEQMALEGLCLPDGDPDLVGLRCSRSGPRCW